MLLGVPIRFGAFIADIVGLVQSIVYRSEWQLGAMSTAGVVFMLTWALDETNHGNYRCVLCGDDHFFLQRMVFLPPEKDEEGATRRHWVLTS